MQLAIDAWEDDDEVAVQAAIAAVFWDYVEEPVESKARIATHLAASTTGVSLRSGHLVTTRTAVDPVPSAKT